MVRKTRRQRVHTIPEVRQSFEHIEHFVDQHAHLSKDKLVSALQKEWMKVFHKSLKKSAAEAFLSHRPQRRTTRRHHGGALAGAPIDYMMRPGVDLAPGQIPTAAGHLPQSVGGPSSFGSYVPYVSKGFWNPEQAATVTGGWPIPYAGTGSNTVKGGSKSSSQSSKSSSHKRKARRGGSMGSLLSQAFTRPIPSGMPPLILQDMQDMWHGKTVGPSPDQVQRGVSYQLGSVYPKPMHF